MVVVGSIVAVVVAAFATAAQVDKKTVVDIEAEMVRIVATAELTPRMYVVVAIVAVDIAHMDLVVLALSIPLST